MNYFGPFRLLSRQSTAVRALRTDAAAHPAHLSRLGPAGLPPGCVAGAQQLRKEETKTWTFMDSTGCIGQICRLDKCDDIYIYR